MPCVLTSEEAIDLAVCGFAAYWIHDLCQQAEHELLIHFKSPLLVLFGCDSQLVPPPDFFF